MQDSISVEVQLRQPEIPSKWDIIPLTQGKETLVDVSDLPLLSEYKWCAQFGDYARPNFS